MGWLPAQPRKDDVMHVDARNCCWSSAAAHLVEAMDKLQQLLAAEAAVWYRHNSGSVAQAASNVQGQQHCQCGSLQSRHPSSAALICSLPARASCRHCQLRTDRKGRALLHICLKHWASVSVVADLVDRLCCLRLSQRPGLQGQTTLLGWVRPGVHQRCLFRSLIKLPHGWKQGSCNPMPLGLQLRPRQHKGCCQPTTACR